MREFTINEEGHTIGCMLRQRLFDCGANFAACVVLHPQDKHLVIKVDSENEHDCLMDAIYTANKDLDQMIREVDTFISHKLLTDEMDVS